MPDTPERAAGRERLDRIADDLIARPDVSWMRMFGAQGLSIGGRVFAFADSTGRLVVKLPEARVEELAGDGDAEHMVMRGRPMHEWAVLGLEAPDERWHALVTEALAFGEELGPR